MPNPSKVFRKGKHKFLKTRFVLLYLERFNVVLTYLKEFQRRHACLRLTRKKVICYQRVCRRVAWDSDKEWQIRRTEIRGARVYNEFLEGKSWQIDRQTDWQTNTSLFHCYRVDGCAALYCKTVNAIHLYHQSLDEMQLYLCTASSTLTTRGLHDQEFICSKYIKIITPLPHPHTQTTLLYNWLVAI